LFEFFEVGFGRLGQHLDLVIEGFVVGLEVIDIGLGGEMGEVDFLDGVDHRLGLLLKIEMLRWLGDIEPQLRVLDTWNAATNAHMIGVNEQLGYRVVREGLEWQKHL